MEDKTRIVVLWARSEQFQRPQFVTAWTESLDEFVTEAADELREGAEDWFRNFGDEPSESWEFWTTHDSVPTPKELARG